jgi:cation transport ATPase
LKQKFKSKPFLQNCRHCENILQNNSKAKENVREKERKREREKERKRRREREKERKREREKERKREREKERKREREKERKREREKVRKREREKERKRKSFYFNGHLRASLLNLRMKHTFVERYGCCHSGKVPMDLMSRRQASLIKPVSFYIQLF